MNGLTKGLTDQVGSGIIQSMDKQLQMEAAVIPIETGVCAWCQKEKGEVAKPNQSHGICTRHYDEVMATIKPRLHFTPRILGSSQ